MKMKKGVIVVVGSCFCLLGDKVGAFLVPPALTATSTSSFLSQRGSCLNAARNSRCPALRDSKEGDPSSSSPSQSSPTSPPASSSSSQPESSVSPAASSASEKGEVELAELGKPIQLDDRDWREFRAKMIAGDDWLYQLTRNVNKAQLDGVTTWAHPLPQPEPGCLLIAHPEYFQTQQIYFNQAVIFLAQHSKEGATGFILNRPTIVKMGQVSPAMGPFANNPLYYGGECGNENTVQVLHPYGPEKVRGAIKIIPGVYIGGTLDDAKALVERGEAKADDFRFFHQLCRWAPGQVEGELQDNVWFCAASSKEIILKHCVQLPVPLWREVLQLMGGKFSLISRDSYNDL